MSAFPHPVLHAPFCSAEAFDRAFRVLETNTVGEDLLPVGGFTRPFLTPGGGYGAGWWSLDSALAAEGVKWTDPALAEGLIANLAAVQRPDGRIPFWYQDAPEAAVYNVHEEITGTPKYIEVCWHLLQRSRDRQLAETAYSLFCRNLDWWETKRQDPRTGLMTAVFEECLMPQLYTGSMQYAPVDTNMDLVPAYWVTAQLAGRLGKETEARGFYQRMAALQAAVREHLWDERQATFAPLWVRTGLHEPICSANAFMVLRHGTASPAQKTALLHRLCDREAYGLEGYTLPSVSRLDPRFFVVRGPYIGNLCWSGSIWATINLSVICGLRECGEEPLAAKLALSTVREFADNYSEFLCPEDGSGQGVQAYSFTAALFVQLIIDEIFGIRYEAQTDSLRLSPLPVPAEMSLTGLTLPNGRTLDVHFKDGAVTVC